MSNKADDILNSLLGHVQSAFGGEIDVSSVVAQGTDGSRIKLSPPRLLVEDSKDEKRKKRKTEKEKFDVNDSSKKPKIAEGSSTTWTFEPIKKMTMPDELPVGAEFTLYHAKIKDTEDGDVSQKRKDKKSKKKDKDNHKDSDKDQKERKERRHKHKKKEKKKDKATEEKDRLAMVPRTLEAQKHATKSDKISQNPVLEEGELPPDGWMALKPEKKLENTDEWLKRKLEKVKKKKDKEKEKGEKKIKSDKKHKSKDKDVSRTSISSSDTKLKSTGTIIKPLSPIRDNSDKAKILPSTWSKRINSLLKSSNDEFTSSDQRSENDKSVSSSSHGRNLRMSTDVQNTHHKEPHSRSFNDKDRDGHRSDRERDHHADKYYNVPERRERSRSRTPTTGRGRNWFRRTDAEWREHQLERIKSRRRSPVRIYADDYTDKHGRIDKRKLLNMATRNVTKLAMSGELPKGYELLSTIKNKTVQQLVDLCQQLHDEDDRARWDRPSSSSESDDEDRYYGSARTWDDHSFAPRGVKPASQPKYDVTEDGIPFLVKTAEQRSNEAMALQINFPVSSGMAHREKEVLPAEDELPVMPLTTALCRIKTNIPQPFTDLFNVNLPMIEPLKPLPPRLPELPSETYLDLAPSTSTPSCLQQDISSLWQSETLPKPMEVSMTVEGASTVAKPVKKPLAVRASFLKSGRKAAEEALKKLMPDFVVSTPTLSDSIATVSTSFATPPVPVAASTVNSASKNFALESVGSFGDGLQPLQLTVSSSTTESSTANSENLPEVNHTDALSAILDQVDHWIGTGKFVELATVERKDFTEPLSPEKVNEDYVKIPARKVPSDPSTSILKPWKSTKDGEQGEAETTSNEAFSSAEKKGQVEVIANTAQDVPDDLLATCKDVLDGILDAVVELEESDTGTTEAAIRKASKKKGKKEKEKKRGKEKSKDSDKSERKRKRDRSNERREDRRSTTEQPAGNKSANKFDQRDPTPYITAITSPMQLAIEAPSQSLKANWENSKNPFVQSLSVGIKDDDSLFMPFRIVPIPKQPVFKPENMVFEVPKCLTAPPTMINDLVARRAKYNLQLQQDPDDRYARRQIENIDREMSAWAASKNIPGRFTGKTGARVLSVEELAPVDPRYNSWARKDLFETAPEHENAFATRILERMGWQKGSGLGREMNGPLEPLKLPVKADRKGLQAAGESAKKFNMPADINGKNPVSLVMEYCAKKHLQPPTFTCIESGPSTARRFLWKCTIDGQEFAPAMAAMNKKVGKTQVCVVALQSLGLVPPTIPGT